MAGDGWDKYIGKNLTLFVKDIEQASGRERINAKRGVLREVLPTHLVLEWQGRQELVLLAAIQRIEFGGASV
jgi:uncharacterized protein Veg